MYMKLLPVRHRNYFRTALAKCTYTVLVTTSCHSTSPTALILIHVSLFIIGEVVAHGTTTFQAQLKTFQLLTLSTSWCFHKGYSKCHTNNLHQQNNTFASQSMPTKTAAQNSMSNMKNIEIFHLQTRHVSDYLHFHNNAVICMPKNNEREVITCILLPPTQPMEGFLLNYCFNMFHLLNCCFHQQYAQ